jgi:hypothetical protein
MCCKCYRCPAIKKVSSRRAISSRVNKISPSTKDKILSALYQGVPNEAIQKRFSYRYSRQQIAALQAWRTMGKY